VVSILHQKGVLRCDLVAKFVLRREGLGDGLRAGTYHITTNMTLADAIHVLSQRPHHAKTARLTIPEGFRLTQIAARVEKAFGIPQSQFMQRATSGDYSLPPYLPAGTKTLEGYLFPETYDIPVKTATADSVIRVLLDQFKKEVQGLPWDNAKALGVTPYGVVTIASMIEREARVDSDRPLIAAVIYNRLKIHMQLGIDATLLYDDPTPGDNTLTSSDLKSDSPYNTRVHVGLPPTPIASPRLSSIKAALEPAHVKYLYYVLCNKDGTGHHRFSVSYDEFLRNKSECLG
jgi:UPF0755 protein